MNADQRLRSITRASVLMIVRSTLSNPRVGDLSVQDRELLA